MRIFKDIANSVYNPAWYRERLNASRWRALFLIFFTYFVGMLLFAAIYLAVPFAAITNEFANEENIRSIYPEGLEITITDGIVSTNVEEPYQIAVPEDWEDEGENEILLTIDTSKDLTLDHIKGYGTIVLTKDSVAFQDENEFRSITLENTNLTITEDSAVDFFESLNAWFYVGVVAAGIILAALLSVWGTIALVILSLIGGYGIKLFTKEKQNLSFGQSFTLALYISVGIAFIDTLASLLLNIFATPFWFFPLAFLVLAFANLRAPSESKSD